MRRRDLLKRMTALGGVGLVAGCLGEGPSGSDDSDGNPGAGGGAGSDSTTPTEVPAETAASKESSSETGTETPTEGRTETPTERPTETPSERPTERPTEARTGTPEKSPTEGTEPKPDVAAADTVSTYSIETSETDCLTGKSMGAPSASVSFSGDAIDVSGTIEAPDPCHEAVIEAIEHEEGAERATVRIAVRDVGTGACMACIGGITYRAEIGFADSVPGTVRVEHHTDDEIRTATEATRSTGK